MRTSGLLSFAVLGFVVGCGTGKATERAAELAPPGAVSASPALAASASAAPVVALDANGRPLAAKIEPVLPPLDFVFDKSKLALVPRAELQAKGKAADPSSARGDMWGDEVGDSFGAGGLGLSGVGEGGGGIGLGSIGTIGHGAGLGSGAGIGSGSGRLSGSHRSSGGGGAQPPSSVNSGEWDDNANFIEFGRYLKTTAPKEIAKSDVSTRRFVVVRDEHGKPVPNCAIAIAGTHGSKSVGDVTLTTTASGRALFFPKSELPGATSFSASAQCQGASQPVAFDAVDADGVVKLDLKGDRVMAQDRTVDVVFVLDTTGSMGEEIPAMTSTIEKVAAILGQQGISVRLGLVEYKDRSDQLLTRVHPMTRDVAGFTNEVHTIKASGGGDTPEDVDAGLETALTRVAFSKDSVARLVFVIGDAPPHLDYQGGATYAESMMRANHDGIVVYTVAASGMDDLGQAVFRQVAAYTGGTEMFVLRGGAGPQSVGGGDPESSCGGTQKNFTTGNLDELIAGKVKDALASVDGDPLAIAGLFQDEKAKPCASRVARQ